MLSLFEGPILFIRIVCCLSFPFILLCVLSFHLAVCPVCPVLSSSFSSYARHCTNQSPQNVFACEQDLALVPFFFGLRLPKFLFSRSMFALAFFSRPIAVCMCLYAYIHTYIHICIIIIRLCHTSHVLLHTLRAHTMSLCLRSCPQNVFVCRSVCRLYVPLHTYINKFLSSSSTFIIGDMHYTPPQAHKCFAVKNDFCFSVVSIP